MSELFKTQLTTEEKLIRLIQLTFKARDLQKRYWKAPKGDVRNNLLIQSKYAEKELDQFLEQL